MERLFLNFSFVALVYGCLVVTLVLLEIKWLLILAFVILNVNMCVLQTSVNSRQHLQPEVCDIVAEQHLQEMSNSWVLLALLVISLCFSFISEWKKERLKCPK